MCRSRIWQGGYDTHLVLAQMQMELHVLGRQ
jgi:hypothetical protein